MKKSTLLSPPQQRYNSLYRFFLALLLFVPALTLTPTTFQAKTATANNPIFDDAPLVSEEVISFPPFDITLVTTDNNIDENLFKNIVQDHLLNVFEQNLSSDDTIQKITLFNGSGRRRKMISMDLIKNYESKNDFSIKQVFEKDWMKRTAQYTNKSVFKTSNGRYLESGSEDSSSGSSSKSSESKSSNSNSESEDSYNYWGYSIPSETENSNSKSEESNSKSEDSYWDDDNDSESKSEESNSKSIDSYWDDDYDLESKSEESNSNSKSEESNSKSEDSYWDDDYDLDSNSESGDSNSESEESNSKSEDSYWDDDYDLDSNSESGDSNSESGVVWGNTYLESESEDSGDNSEDVPTFSVESSESRDTSDSESKDSEDSEESNSLDSEEMLFEDGDSESMGSSSYYDIETNAMKLKEQAEHEDSYLDDLSKEFERFIEKEEKNEEGSGFDSEKIMEQLKEQNKNSDYEDAFLTKSDDFHNPYDLTQQANDFLDQAEKIKSDDKYLDDLTTELEKILEDEEEEDNDGNEEHYGNYYENEGNEGDEGKHKNENSLESFDFEKKIKQKIDEAKSASGNGNSPTELVFYKTFSFRGNIISSSDALQGSEIPFDLTVKAFNNEGLTKLAESLEDNDIDTVSLAFVVKAENDGDREYRTEENFRIQTSNNNSNSNKSSLFIYTVVAGIAIASALTFLIGFFLYQKRQEQTDKCNRETRTFDYII